ncbi:MAG: TspO/MBR family protein [Planctomycetota bacterium]
MSSTEQPISTLRSFVHLVLAVAVCFAAAGIGAQFMPGEWYAGLNKPTWNPPNWIFGPVWTALYTMMAVSAWLVWCKLDWKGGRDLLMLFGVQLALNAAWSWLFFGLHRPELALIDIVALWLAIVATIWSFRPVSQTAAWLLVPYLAWVTFATLLNLALWRMN